MIVSLLSVTVGVSAVGPSSGSVGVSAGVLIGPEERPTSHGAVDWVDENPSVGPTGRGYMPMVYAQGSDRVVLFGGIISYSGVILDNATWTYNLNTNLWVQANPDPRPPPLGGHSMAYDAGSDRVVLFGGCASCPPNPWVGNFDTWAYDVGANVWTNMSPSTHPPAMIGGRMAYDAESDRIVLFGGLSTSFTFYSSTWAYDFDANSWTEMAPSAGPRARNYQGMAYDAESDRIILSGGGDFGGDFADTWAYDLNTNAWTNMQPTRAPSARSYPGMDYDAQSDRVILFGGSPGGTTGDAQTWAYDYNSNAWTNMNSPAPPPARSRHGLAYDSESDRTIIFGGLVPTTAFHSDTWSYDYVANHPGAPFNLQAQAGDADVVLRWHLPLTDGGSAITGYRVYRGTSAGSLSALGDAPVEAIYNDSSVTNGITYYYAVSAVTAAGEGPPSNEDSATPLPGLDTISPTISITSPAEGATLTSTSITVTGTASDNVALSKVELSTNGTNWLLANGTISWSGTLTLTVGPNTIYARAVDSSGNTRNTNITVTFVPPPPPAPPFLLIGVAAGIAVAAIALGFLFLRRKRAS